MNSNKPDSNPGSPERKPTLQEKLEEVLRNRILYIGENPPAAASEGCECVQLYSGCPNDLIAELLKGFDCRYLAEQIFFHVLLRGGDSNPFREISSKWFVDVAAPKIAELLAAPLPAEGVTRKFEYKIPSCESGSITVSSKLEKGADSQSDANRRSTSRVSAPENFAVNVPLDLTAFVVQLPSKAAVELMGRVIEYGKKCFELGREACGSTPECVPEPIKVDGKFSTDGKRIFNTVSREEIPWDEPLFLLRARDWYAIDALRAYQGACELDCNELHRAGIMQVKEKFETFRREKTERMKQPGITKHLKLEAAPECVSAPTDDQFETAWKEYNAKGNAGGWERVAFISGFGKGFSAALKVGAAPAVESAPPPPTPEEIEKEADEMYEGFTARYAYCYPITKSRRGDFWRQLFINLLSCKEVWALRRASTNQ